MSWVWFPGKICLPMVGDAVRFVRGFRERSLAKWLLTYTLA